jgi:hypothetical protein
VTSPERIPLLLLFLCIGFFSLCFVDSLLLFFLWVVFTCALICFVLLMDGFSSLIFYIQVFPYLGKEEGWGFSVSPFLVFTSG